MPSQQDLAARVEELERVVATVASLYRERSREAALAAARPDPVAITAALHPRSLRSRRSTARRTPTNGTIGLRFVLFDPSRND